MVHYRDRQGASVQNSVRELSLLDGEKIEQLFVPENGLVSDTPWKGQLLVLTNQRLISFVQSDGHQETLLAPLDELKGVSVKANARGSRDLLQGFALMIIGIVSYLVLGYVLEGVAIALALGAAIVVVGLLFMIKYLFWEEEGSITFQAGDWEVNFPYRTNLASSDVYNLVDRFFQLKLSAKAGHHPTARGAQAASGSQINQPETSAPLPPGDFFYDL